MTEENKKEEQIVTLNDFEALRMNGGFERYFECKKCKSSIICLSEEYSKNNTANMIEVHGLDFEKVVLCCGNCKHKDILIKFLVERKRYISPEIFGPVRKFTYAK